ncbi:hypothetical protein [Methylobacterium sp. Leaf466]|uniref:hypothetical protein n=1 Tax=Methylobacterium sp. Leaf466 TaxID=1736386 RepID=UPI0012E3D645|nr:hypothetical protein [Methylobacterium sp. Leaf466]
MNNLQIAAIAPTRQAPASAGISFRLSDIHKIMKGRYGGPCRTAHAERYILAAIPEMIPRARSWRYAVSWARDWVPDLLEEKGEEFIHAAWARIAARKRRHLTTDQLSRLLKVTDDEPADLGLRCIPSASRNAKARATERKAKNASAEAARRLRKKPDLTPREQSLTATKPWEAAGVSRSTWYAKRRAGTLQDVANTQEVADLDGFVCIVSDTALGQERGHPIPLDPSRCISGEVKPPGRVTANTPASAERVAPDVAANENVPAAVAA